MVFSKRFGKIFRRAGASLTKRGSSPPPLSYEQAMIFFDQQATRDDLALGYPQEACFARAHLICEAALRSRFLPKKAWAVKDDKQLRFTMPNGQAIQYWVHVAAVLPVLMPDGKTEDLVFDPALFDAPVTLKEWGKLLNAPEYLLEIKRLGKPPMNYSGDYNTRQRTSKALADRSHPRHPLQTIKEYQPLEIIPRTVFASRFYREHILPALGQWADRTGSGWVSVDPYPGAAAKPGPALAPHAPPKPEGGV